MDLFDLVHAHRTNAFKRGDIGKVLLLGVFRRSFSPCARPIYYAVKIRVNPSKVTRLDKIALQKGS